MSLHDATIRDAVHALLLAANTLAGERVQREQIDEMPDIDLPTIVVMVDSQGRNLATAGTAPVFDTTADLLVLARIADAKPSDAVSKVDVLADQAREAILCAPSFLSLCRVLSWRIGRTFRNEGRVIIAEARIVLSLAWQETIEPRTAEFPIFTGADLRSSSGPAIGVNINV